MVSVIVGKEQYVDRLAELVIECTSLLTRVDQYLTPLVRHERDSLAQPPPLHESVGSPADSRVRHITVEHHMLDHGTTVKTRALRHNEIMRRGSGRHRILRDRSLGALVSEGVPTALDRPFSPASPIPKRAAARLAAKRRHGGNMATRNRVPGLGRRHIRLTGDRSAMP